MSKINVDEIYSKHFRTVYKYLVYLTHDTELAEDLTQETFCKAIKNINSFRGDCKISVWLCEIAKNLWLNELKRTEKISSEDIQDNIDSLYNVEDEFINRQDMILFYKKLQEIKEPIKDILYLKLFSNLTFKEIGEIKGKSEVWARVNFYRGKQKVKELMENEERM